MPARPTGALRVGPAGWSYADWEGVVYPKPHPRGFHPLPFLADLLSCVELNSSFYSHTRPANAARWNDLLREHPDFRFVAKLGGMFTHGPMLEAGELERQRDAFLEGIAPIAERTSALLVQFPLGFRDNPPSRRRLDRIRGAFAAYPLVLELRHRSWFSPSTVRWIERCGFSLAAIDLPDGPDHPPADAPTPGRIGYLRLHGRNARTWFDKQAGRDQKYDYLYRPEEIGTLAERARRLARSSDETFVVTNNHFAGKAVANALELLHELVGTTPALSGPLAEHYPRLRSIVRPTGQQSLFE